MSEWIGLFLSGQFARFLMAGGTSALANWLSRIALTPITGYIAALFLAYAIGIATAFVLNERYVFARSSTRRHQQVIYFVGFNLCMMPVVITISWALSETLFPRIGMTFFPREIAHAIAVASPVPISFLMHKFFTFKGA
ncbi:GtrA family protein [Alteraurantiacibacter aestuarii]|uniref:GtrA family protein n=1 Tax=Alteraurantiacibacter aestuarii TaxID=650004 RepID=A0A844ZJ04_9SPHN|nr:GtrA family protein [Alteraurantiacibacter aestuarii]MXO87423.1 GtrA family protein [Alteraurantiacibacter aestuarii]